MSGVTMLVRWLCSSPASAMHVRWVCKPRSSPASENAPLGNTIASEPTGCVLSKVGQEGLSRWSCCHWILGKECTLTPSIRSASERELLDLHFHRRPRTEFQDTTGNGNRKKAKTKASDPIQRRIAKDLQITKLGDDQERRP